MYKGLKIRLAQGEPVIKDINAAKLPELFRGMPKLYPEKCPEACSECIDLCPSQALLTDPLRIDLGKCTFCPICSEACPENAIEFTSEYHLSCSSREQLLFSGNTPFIKPKIAAEEIRKQFGHSLKLRQVSAGGCNGCEMELNALGNVNFDMGRFGIEFVASPRHADGIVITGPVSKAMSLALFDTYEAVPNPKIVIAFGACAISGGVFYDSKEIDRSFFDKFKVDLFVPGCPPHPLTFISGILDWLGRK
ncbi:MAG: 4Fe-4S binding protein [Bacteroidota bacterium]|nr:4Fe-4S binding protein [Bacteroidota bacterium]